MTGKERREQLLDIGRRLFAERGLDGTSIEEIAAQAGVSKPVVYEHFGGKEGLYAVVVDREVERFLTLATRLLQGEDTMEKFEVAAVELLRYIEDNSDGFRILVRDSNPSSGSGHLRQPDQRHRQAGRVHTRRRAQGQRGYDPKLAPMYAQMLVGMVAFTGPVVARRAEAEAGSGGRAPGEPGLERAVPARPEAGDLRGGDEAAARVGAPGSRRPG